MGPCIKPRVSPSMLCWQQIESSAVNKPLLAILDPSIIYFLLSASEPECAALTSVTIFTCVAH